MIPYGRQHISDEDIQAVVDVLKSDFLTQGPVVPAFERAVCDYTGAKHAIAVSSGTSALHIACLSLGLKKGDWLWTTPISFVASANCGLYCGASIDFIDIDPDTWNISIDGLKDKLEKAQKENRLPKVIVAVHLCGLSCDMESIRKLSHEYGFYVIEDACHAIGGKFQNQPIGNCQYSDITVYSFHPVKTITTGEGGMAVTNSSEFCEKMMLLRSHGITRDPEKMTHEPDGPWYYQQISLGFNFRMTDIQAALGISQLKQLDRFVEKRNRLAELYDDFLNVLPIQKPYRADDNYSGRHLYVIRFTENKNSKTHQQIFDSLREQGIGVNVHYIPIHTQPYFQSMGFRNGMYPNAEAYYREAISLPMYVGLTDNEIKKICTSIKKSLM